MALDAAGVAPIPLLKPVGGLETMAAQAAVAAGLAAQAAADILNCLLAEQLRRPARLGAHAPRRRRPAGSPGCRSKAGDSARSVAGGDARSRTAQAARADGERNRKLPRPCRRPRPRNGQRRERARPALRVCAVRGGCAGAGGRRGRRLACRRRAPAAESLPRADAAGGLGGDPRILGSPQVFSNANV